MNAVLPGAASRANSLTLAPPGRRDGAALYELIAASPPLDLNSRYAYLLLCEHHAGTSVVARNGDTLVGAITAYAPPAQSDTLFIWQVAVAASMRGQGLATQMLEHLLQRCAGTQRLRWMETTISPSNTASHGLFSRFATQHQVACNITTLFEVDDFGASGHEKECLYRLGPWP